MGRYGATGLLFVAYLAISNAIYPLDKEFIYKYKGVVKAGTEIPELHVSEFIVEANLHVQRMDDALFLKFTDVVYKLYNGEYFDYEDMKLKGIPMIPEMEDFFRVFKIVYDDHFKVTGIVTDTNEKIFSRNMKKAIASIFQLDMTHKTEFTKPYAFMAEEHSIYGRGNMFYSILPFTDYIQIQKMHEMKTSEHMYMREVSNVIPGYCEAPFEEPLSHDSQRVYIMNKDGNHFVLKHIEAVGGFYGYPLKAKSDAHFVFVNQTFDLTTTVPITTKFVMNSEFLEDSLTFQMPEFYTKNGMIPDFSFGTHHVDFEHVFTTMTTMMNDLISYIHNYNLDIKHPDIKKLTTVHKLQKMFMYFDTLKLEEFYHTFTVKETEHDVLLLDLFHQFLPLIGTQASALLMKKIIFEHKVDDVVAIHMLHEFPLNFKSPTEKFLVEMEDMIYWGTEITWNVRKAAILSFANFIGHTHRFQKKVKFYHHHHHHDEHSNTHVHFGYIPNGIEKFVYYNNVYEKYVMEFINRLKTSTDFDTRMVYTSTFFNMKIFESVKYLLPIVKGEIWHDHHSKLATMFATNAIVHKDSDRVFEIFWPIFTDHSMHIELRLMSYYFIMTAHPTMTKLLNIFWFMQHETDMNLYYFHYMYLKSWEHSTDICHHQHKLFLTQLLKFTKTPVYGGFSGIYQENYMDVTYGFGHKINYFAITTDTSKIMNLRLTSQIFNKPMDYYEVYVKVHGFDASFYDKFKLDTTSLTKLFNYDELWNMISSIPSNDKIHIEVVMMQYHQIFQTYYYDFKTIKDISHMFDFFLPKPFVSVKKQLRLYYQIYNKVVMPNEMGMATMANVLVPVIQYNHENVTKEVVNKITSFEFDNHYHTLMNSQVSMSFYNPWLKMWQGVHKHVLYESQFPLYFDLTYNIQQHNLKMTFKRYGDIYKDTFGFKSIATSFVYTTKKDLLIESCKTCHDVDLITHDDKNHNEFPLMTKEDYVTGYHYYMGAFDDQHFINKGYMKKLWSQWASPLGKSFTSVWWYNYLTIRNMFVYYYLHPTPGTSGFVFKVTPSTEIPVTHIDLNFRVNQELVHGDYMHLPSMKISKRATYSLKDHDKTIKTYDMSLNLDMNMGHTINNLKMQLTRIIPGQKDFKICMEGVKKWIKDGVTGHFNVAMSQTAEPICKTEDTVLDITMTGVKSDLQKGDHEYGDCSHFVKNEIVDKRFYDCYMASNTIRQYEYDIKTTNLPTEYKTWFYSWFDFFKGWYMPYYSYLTEHTVKVPDHSMKVKMHYPLAGTDVDVNIFTPHDGFSFSGIPTRYWSCFGLMPDNMVHSKMFMFWHKMGMTKTCTVTTNSIYLYNKVVPNVVPTDWMLFMGKGTDSKFGVYLKKIESMDKMAFKLVYGDHTFEMYPFEDKFQFKLDGKLLPETEYFMEDLFNYKTFDHGHSVALTIPHYAMHIWYDGGNVHFEMPKFDVKFTGQCFEH